MFRKLLVPVDLSPQSMLMANTALRMGGYGTKQVIIYFVTGEGSGNGSLTEALSQELDRPSMDHKVLVEIGSDPAYSIVKAANEQQASLIAMAASGKGRVREFIVGSTSLAVIRRSKVPVLLDKFPLAADDDPEGYCDRCPPLLDQVLVALDLTKASKRMLPAVQQLVDAGAKNMTLFHVVQPSKFGVRDEKSFQEVKKRIETYRDKLEARDCQIEMYIHFGTATYNILEAAREVDATVIVMGTTGKSYLHGMTLGSTSEGVVKGSTRPVILLPV
ncbi:MAG: universal stress protein [Methanomassiliicoccales archaeon]|nr:universal stress protein [Methanomassiliicoccales archaeon]